jgi:hypothetical protein
MSLSPLIVSPARSLPYLSLLSIRISLSPEQELKVQSLTMIPLFTSPTRILCSRPSLKQVLVTSLEQALLCRTSLPGPGQFLKRDIPSGKQKSLGKTQTSPMGMKNFSRKQKISELLVTALQFRKRKISQLLVTVLQFLPPTSSLHRLSQSDSYLLCLTPQCCAFHMFSTPEIAE